VNAEIIAVGSELLTPFRQDTNSLYLTEKLNTLGVEVSFKTIVGDNLKDIVRVTKAALSRSDILIFSGGLGPTEDDLTREAVAQTLGLHLKRDPDIVQAIERRFTEHGWKMSPNTWKPPKRNRCGAKGRCAANERLPPGHTHALVGI